MQIIPPFKHCYSLFNFTKSYSNVVGCVGSTKRHKKQSARNACDQPEVPTL